MAGFATFAAKPGQSDAEDRSKKASRAVGEAVHSGSPRVGTGAMSDTVDLFGIPRHPR